MTKTYLSMTQEFKSIIDYLRFGISQSNEKQLFYGHGTDNAWDEMWMLILGSLSLPMDLNPMVMNAQLTQDEKVFLCRQLEKRIFERIPVPYLTKTAYFCDLSFYVDERVLIPRSPIAELIRQNFSPWVDVSSVERILDIGTGSGCIAIACAHAFPDALVDAVDISTDALDVANKNLKLHGLQDSLRLIQSDCFDSISPAQYDIIVSNPPYVGHEEMMSLPEEYQHEPNLALEAKQEGLAIVEKILDGAHDYLSAEGILVVEVGNTEQLLLETYPHVPFTWLEFECGGHGVFMLTKRQLADYFK